jgi:predicted nucleic acid-binding protein
MDAFLAASADVHGLTLVTRNISDFDALGQTLLNPWAEQ